jgi:hypothetical protein
LSLKAFNKAFEIRTDSAPHKVAAFNLTNRKFNTLVFDISKMEETGMGLGDYAFIGALNYCHYSFILIDQDFARWCNNFWTDQNLS